MTRLALYPGTFDPITNGHSDLVARASRMFDRVLVTVAENTGKQAFLPMEERIELTREVLKGIPNVHIYRLQGLLVDFAHKQGASCILRGLRAVSDFDHEFQLAGMNRRLAPDVETLFLTPAENYSFISSSLVREIATFGGEIGEFVHPAVVAALRKRIG